MLNTDVSNVTYTPGVLITASMFSQNLFFVKKFVTVISMIWYVLSSIDLSVKSADYK